MEDQQDPEPGQATVRASPAGAAEGLSHEAQFRLTAPLPTCSSRTGSPRSAGTSVTSCPCGQSSGSQAGPWPASSTASVRMGGSAPTGVGWVPAGCQATVLRHGSMFHCRKPLLPGPGVWAGPAFLEEVPAPQLPRPAAPGHRGGPAGGLLTALPPRHRHEQGCITVDSVRCSCLSRQRQRGD